MSDPEGGVSFIPYAEVVAWEETTRGRDPPDSLEEVDVDDEVLEDVDGGIGDRADRPNAGEGEFNRLPLSFSSACGGERGQTAITRSTQRNVNTGRVTHLLIPLRQTLHPVQC